MSMHHMEVGAMRYVPWGLSRGGRCGSKGCQSGGHLPLVRPMLAGCLRPLLCAHSAIRLQHTQRCSFDPHVAVGVISQVPGHLRECSLQQTASLAPPNRVVRDCKGQGRAGQCHDEGNTHHAHIQLAVIILEVWAPHV